MAKKSAEDLDAELARLEAELAALDGKKTAAPPPPARPPPEAPPKKKLALKLPARKKDAPPPPPPPPPAPAPDLQRPLEPSNDASLWRREEDAWVRTVPGSAPVVRRILDEQGNVVREEPASARDVEKEPAAKAERGVGKLFGRFRK